MFYPVKRDTVSSLPFAYVVVTTRLADPCYLYWDRSMENHQQATEKYSAAMCVLSFVPLPFVSSFPSMPLGQDWQRSDTKYSHRSSAYNSAESLPYLPYECTCAFLIISRVSEGKELFLFYTRFICKFQTALKKIKFQLRRSYLESGKIEISGLFDNFTGVRSASKKAI